MPGRTTGRRKSPKHVTPAHQAGREAAQVQDKPIAMEDGMQTVTPGAGHLEATPNAYGTWQFAGEVFVPEANPHAGRKGRVSEHH
jgi:hypothetical protein